MASIGTLNVTVKFNTKDLSIPLKLIAIPARVYLWVINLFRKMAGKKMTALNIKIEETEKKERISDGLNDEIIRLEQKLDEMQF